MTTASAGRVALNLANLSFLWRHAWLAKMLKFTAEEWKTILQGPPSAGMYVAFSQKGGSIRESFSMAKAYAEAKQQPQGQLGLYVQLLPVALHGPAHEPAQQPVWQRRQAADDRRLGARAWRGSSRHRAIL